MFNSKALQEAIQKSGLTQEQIGEKLGVSQTKVSKWVNGKDLDSDREAKYRLPLAQILKVSVEELGIDAPRSAIRKLDAEWIQERSETKRVEVPLRERLAIINADARSAQERASKVRAEREARPKRPEDPKKKDRVAKAQATREAKEYLAKVWYGSLQEHFSLTVSKAVWSKSDGGRITSMLASKSLDELEAALRYTVRNWKEIGPRFFKDRSTPLPTIAFVDSFVDNMVQESKSWTDSSDVEAEWDAWWRDHPYEQPPEDLQKRYEEATKRR